MRSLVAAVQMESEPFAVEDNLRRASRHIEKAAADGAKLVLLPELFHTGYTYHRRLFDHMEPIGGPTTRWMSAWSRDLGIHLGACIGEQGRLGCYDTFVLTTPSGDTHTYRKRFPAFFEKLFFRCGHAEGIFHTSIGRIGIMICWDMVHTRLARELAGRIDLLLISSAWPDITTGNLPLPLVDRWMTRHTTAAPQRLAQLLGVPVIYANMAGRFATRVPALGLQYASEFAGSSSIHDACGTRLEILGNEEQIISASLTIKNRHHREESTDDAVVPFGRTSSRQRAAA